MSNALVLLIGGNGGDVPADVTGSISATATCVVVGVLPGSEGDTTVHLAETKEQLALPVGLDSMWSGPLNPDGELVVRTVDGHDLIRTMHIGACRVEIWTDHPDVPNTVWILIEQASGARRATMSRV